MKALILILLLASCTPKYYYPIVESCRIDYCRIKIDRGVDQIIIYVTDSTLAPGDTVKFIKGVQKIEVTIENERPYATDYIIP